MFAALIPLILPVSAHVGAPVDAIDVHPVGERGRVLEASIGLAWTETGEQWDWVCHEAITTPDAVTTPRFAVAGRRWLATVPRLEQARTEADAVYWTDDGCTWSVAEGLTGHEVPEVALTPDGGVALAVTADEASQNHIYRSADGGQSFTPVVSLAGHTFTSVVTSPGAAGTAMATSVDAEGTGYIHWSTDAGATWSAHGVVEGEPVAMALHPTDATQGYLVLDGVGVETLLRTTDAGASVDVLLDPEGFIADVAVSADGQAWVAFNGSAFLHAADGVTFEVATEAPPGLGVTLHGDQVLLSTRFELVNNALAEGNRTEGFSPVFSFVSFEGPLDCPAGTEGADVCAPLFIQLQESLGLVDFPDTGGSGTGSGDGGTGSGDDGGSGDGGTGGGEADTAAADPAEEGTAKDGGGCGKSALLVLLPLGVFGFRRRRPGGD